MFYLLQQTEEDDYAFRIIDTNMDKDVLYRKLNSDTLEGENRKLMIVELYCLHNPATIKS
jgi:hypothetical protein